MRTARDVMTRHPVTSSPDSTIEDAAVQMQTFGIRHLVVVNALGKLAGLLSDSAVFEHGWFVEGAWIPVSPQIEGRSIASLVRPVEAVPPDLDLLAMLRLLLSLDEDMIVIIDKDRVPIGVFTEHDAMMLASEEVRDDLTVAEVMATELVTATPDMPLQDAWDEMRQNEIRHMPIREGNRLVAVASIRDLLQIGASVTAAGTMARLVAPGKSFYTATPQETVRSAARRMGHHKIGCLPVLDREGALCGLVSVTDTIKALLPRQSGIHGGET